VLAGDLQADVGPGVAGADHQHGALAELRRVAVLAGVELHDGGVELGRERRDARDPIRARGDHHAVGLEAVLPGADHVAVALAGEPLHADAAAHRQLEPRRVGLEVVGHLVPGRERPGGRRERPAVLSMPARSPIRRRISPVS